MQAFVALTLLVGYWEEHPKNLSDVVLA